jgi:hypothetical protein
MKYNSEISPLLKDVIQRIIRDPSILEFLPDDDLFDLQNVLWAAVMDRSNNSYFDDEV